MLPIIIIVNKRKRKLTG